MAESWREACWRAEQEVAEYRDVIVPAMLEKVRALEERCRELEERELVRDTEMTVARRELRVTGRERDAAERMLMLLEREQEFTRDFILRHGLQYALAEEWTKKNRAKPESEINEREVSC